MSAFLEYSNLIFEIFHLVHLFFKLYTRIIQIYLHYFSMILCNQFWSLSLFLQ